MQLRLLTVPLLAILLFLAGCRSIQVTEDRKSPTAVEAGEAVAVILNFSSRESPADALAAEEKFCGCVTRVLRRKHPHIRIVPADEFRSAAFPGLDIEAAPRSPESFFILSGNLEFQKRITPLGIRYLVIVGEEESETRPDWGDILCGASYPYGGCFGLKTWKKTSRVGAVIIDVKQAVTAGEVKSTVSGHHWIAILAILPFGLPTFTEGRACDELGEAVARFITGAVSPPQ